MGGGGGTGARGGDGAARSVGAPAAASGVEGVRVPAGGEKPLALVALLSRALSGDEAGGFFRLPARAAPKPPSARAAGGLRPHRRAGVAVPSLYKHVESLDALRAEVALVAVRELTDRMRRAAVGRARGEALRALARACRAYVREHPGR